MVEWREKEGGVERERVGLRESEITFACCCFSSLSLCCNEFETHCRKRKAGASLPGRERELASVASRDK